MKAKEIIKIIENVCPERLAYSWDNVGLLCGDENKDVKKVFVTLDTNINTVKEAISKNADMIVSHHPILLDGIKRIDYSTSVGQMLKLLIENNIPLFAAHTNMDTAKGGINDKLAEIFELTDVKILDQHTDDSSAGLGRYGRLEKTYGIRHSNTVGNDVSATVCNEFRHTYGTGDCKQFRYKNYGGVCRFCENRHHCIYACTGFRKCVFDFYCTKFRRGQV